jgi:hypothetical protein
MERPDALDIEEIRQMTESRAWALVRQRIDSIAAAKVAELRSPSLDHAATQEVRGFLAGIDRVLGVPDQLREEWRQRTKGDKR